MKQQTLTLGWLYPELMSTYGDRGNILVLKKRCAWRNILLEIVPIDQTITDKQLESLDLIFGGGAQDREQEIVMRDLRGKKGQAMKHLIEKDVPALFVCGSPQLMGEYYEPSVGERIEGLGIFPIISLHPGSGSQRLIGNVVAEVAWGNFLSQPTKAELQRKTIIVGFENHGGRTYLKAGAKPFAHILKGNGNNGTDGTEGVVYKNAVGCYFHGPLLPKNPQIADWFIHAALEVKYQTEQTLSPLDDTLEIQAQKTIAKRLGVEI